MIPIGSGQKSASHPGWPMGLTSEISVIIEEQPAMMYFFLNLNPRPIGCAAAIITLSQKATSGQKDAAEGRRGGNFFFKEEALKEGFA